VIAVLGAESTGKTELSHALAARLQARGVATTVVAEYLREWCDREGRPPRLDEQSDIAAEQMRRIAEAAKQGVVVADTTAVMTAIYSDMRFGDTSLYAPALKAHTGYAITLLTALDIPWVADGLQRDGPHVRDPVNAKVRAALTSAKLPFTVIHGLGTERLSNAWNAITAFVDRADDVRSATSSKAGNSGWSWSCEKCSDPICEHRLFTELLTRP
jgi:nicotinamide riboside kinase